MYPFIIRGYYVLGWATAIGKNPTSIFRGILCQNLISDGTVVKMHLKSMVLILQKWRAAFTSVCHLTSSHYYPAEKGYFGSIWTLQLYTRIDHMHVDMSHYCCAWTSFSFSYLRICTFFFLLMLICHFAQTFIERVFQLGFIWFDFVWFALIIYWDFGTR